MPYIKQERRKALDEHVEKLAENILKASRAGELNYTITTLLAKTLPERPGYSDHNETLGVLDAVSKEYYRRVVSKYEDVKARQNGDLEQYKRLEPLSYYLAHPVASRFKVRDEIQPQLEGAGLFVINPFMDWCREGIFYDEKNRDDVDAVMVEEEKVMDWDEVVKGEKSLIRASKGLFAYVPYESIGTTMEIFYNSRVLGRGKELTFVYLDNPVQTKYLNDHPWLKAHATVSTNLEELVQAMKRT